MSAIKNKLIKGTIWSVLGQMASLLITLITNIWLARLLSPKEFGQVSIIMFFITLANVFTESGLGGALVRKKNASKLDYSTVFVVNLLLSIFCFFVLFSFSGLISKHYNDTTIANLLVVCGCILIINAFQMTQNAKIISDMRFKQKSIYRFIAVLIGSSVGITLAYNGFGVWSIVCLQILIAAINTILLWMFEGFYLNLRFSKKSFKELYGFGINTTLASLLNTGFDNIYQLILAKYFSMSQTGLYYQAKKLQDVPGGIITMLSQSVLFSSLAKLQDNKEAFARAYNKITLYLLVVLGFISCFIYIYSKSIVELLYGAQWMGAVFYMKLLTIASFFYMQENINRIIFKVYNKTKKILHLEYIKKAIQTISICLGLYYMSLEVLIIGFVITNSISYFINYFFSRRIIDSFNWTELLVLFKIILVCVICAFVFEKFANSNFSEALISLPFFVFTYCCLLYFMRIINIKKEIVTMFNSYHRKSI